MAFSINTNLSAFQAYNALSKVNKNTEKAQLRLVTGKRINSSADDTSGYRIGKELEGKTIIQKAQLNNGSAAKNYLSTAEASLQEINDLLNQISAKYTDAQDPTKNKGAIAKDINSLAEEIDSILKNTSFNGHNLLEQSDGTALTNNDVFDVDGNVTMDFAGDSYLKVDDLNTILNGGTIPDPGVSTIFGTSLDGNQIINGGSMSINPTMTITYDDGTSESTNITVPWQGQLLIDSMIVTANQIYYNFLNADSNYILEFDSASNFHLEIYALNGKNITSLNTTVDGGIDLADYLGVKMVDSGGSTVGGLLSSDADTVLSTASDLTTVTNNVKNALGRIGNLTQVVENRSDYLTSSIANISSSLSRIFDADVAAEQLNATKGSISSQLGTAMLSQINSRPQELLSLFS